MNRRRDEEKKRNDDMLAKMQDLTVSLVYVCMSVWVYVCMYCLYCMYVWAYVCMYVCMLESENIIAYMHIYCIHIYIHTYTTLTDLLSWEYTYIHTYIHPYIHTYKHTYMNPYIHTGEKDRGFTEAAYERRLWPEEEVHQPCSWW